MKKMTSTRRLIFKQPAYIISAVIFLILVLIFCFSYIFNQKTDANGQSGSPSTTNTKDFIENSKDTTNDSVDYQNHTSNNIKLSATQEGTENIIVSTQLENYSDGTCRLDISNNDNTYSQTVDIIYTPELSTCAGFNVPISKIGNGTWQINLTVTSKGETNKVSTSMEVR